MTPNRPATDEGHFDTRSVHLRYENFQFFVLVAGAISIAGVAIGVVVPPVGGLLIVSGHGIGLFFFVRYYNTRCPRCGDRFASFWGKLVMGKLRPTRCRACGLPAGHP